MRTSAAGTRLEWQSLGALAIGFVLFSGCGRITHDASPADDSFSGFVAEVRKADCFPRELPVADTGEVACSLAAVSFSADQDCACDEPGLAKASPELEALTIRSSAVSGHCDGEQTPLCSDACVCEVAKLGGAAAEACLTSAEPSGVEGWCYVSPSQGLGAASLVADCSPSSARTLRLFGEWQRPGEQVLVLACAKETRRPVPPRRKDGELGGVCQPLSEEDPEFHGFSLAEIAIDEYTPACRTGTCVIQGFQGRISCPYGQEAASNGCTVSGSNEPVLAAVAPQLIARPPSLASVCSCRCAGPGAGPFCSCPAGMECAKLIDDLGIVRRDIAGSYCLPEGARYERATVDLTATCQRDLENCSLDR